MSTAYQDYIREHNTGYWDGWGDALNRYPMKPWIAESPWYRQGYIKGYRSVTPAEVRAYANG